MNNKKGISIRKWCTAYESEVVERIKKLGTAHELLSLQKEHEKKLNWLMHERITHLLVMIMVGVVMLFSVTFILFMPDSLPASLPMFAISFILTCFYVRHYYFLENTVQRWYTIDEDITKKLASF